MYRVMMHKTSHLCKFLHFPRLVQCVFDSYHEDHALRAEHNRVSTKDSGWVAVADILLLTLRFAEKNSVSKVVGEFDVVLKA